MVKKMFEEASSYIKIIGVLLVCVGTAGLVFAAQMGDVSAGVEIVLGSAFGITVTVGVALLAALETFVKKLDEMTAEKIEELEKKVEKLEDEVEELEDDNEELQDEIDELKDDKVEELEDEVEELEEQVEADVQ